MQWLAGIVVKEIISKLGEAGAKYLSYLLKKKERNDDLKDNSKKLDEAIKSGDEKAIEKASEKSLNNSNH